MVAPDYMSRQDDINHKMRVILTDWLVEVHLKFRLRHETLFLCFQVCAPLRTAPAPPLRNHNPSARDLARSMAPYELACVFFLFVSSISRPQGSTKPRGSQPDEAAGARPAAYGPLSPRQRCRA